MMKKTKKIAALALTLIMAFGITSTAFASDVPEQEPPVKIVLSSASAQAFTNFIQDVYQHNQNQQFQDADIQAVVRNFYLNVVPVFASSFANGQALLNESCTPYAAASYHPDIFPAYVTDAATCDQWKTMDSWNNFDFSQLNYLGAHTDLADAEEPGTAMYFHLGVMVSTSHFFLTFGDFLNNSYNHSTQYHGKGVITEKGIMEVYAVPVWKTMGFDVIDLEYAEMTFTSYKEDVSEIWAGDVLASLFLGLSAGA